MSAAKPYANPYLAGAGLGLVVLGCFVVSGQGLGASGAFANIAAGVIDAVSPEAAASNSYFAGYLAEGLPWTAWMVIEVLGLIGGASLSALLAGRFKREVVGGPSLQPRPRLMFAAGGGALMGLGAVLARGCTSGQALSGGGLLSVGSWTFMGAVFVAGFAAAPLARSLWRLTPCRLSSPPSSSGPPSAGAWSAPASATRASSPASSTCGISPS